MSDYIPPELIIQILLKLPTRSLLRFTSVCKSWRCIITSPSFISSYLYKPTNQLLVNRYDEHDKLYHYSLLDVAEHKPFTVISSYGLDFPFERNLVIVGSCRGIVCLSDKYFVGHPIALWNPCLRKHLVLPNPTVYPERPTDFALGFGVANAKDNDFKVVRMVFSDNSPLSFLCGAEVFSLRTGRWRRLGVDVKFPNIKFVWSHVFVSGVVHWLACDMVGAKKILVFRMAQEVFDEIKLPNELTMEHEINLSLASIGESLAVIQYNYDFRFDSCDVWLMQAYGDESSWTRWYVFLLGDNEEVVALRKNNEVLVASDLIGLYAFDLENVEKKNLEIYGHAISFYVDNYVESLHLLRGQSEIAEE